MPALGQAGPWFGYLVYVLVDPRDLLPFYVGITCRPKGRWAGHHSDPASSAYHRLRELREAGIKCRVRIMAENLDRATALATEKEYVFLYRGSILNLPRVAIFSADEETDKVARAIHVERYGRDL